MKKKSFVLSWGRKMFFGLGWAITSLVALTYFQSMLFPQTMLGWTYIMTTFVGHYGMILSLVYFLLYCPVVALVPTYYVSRLWSIFLLLLINIFIFIDGMMFTKYRFHMTSFLWKFMSENGANEAFGLTGAKLFLFVFIILVGFGVMWFRGERIWRHMQTRFSNPVKNWYLFLILICFGTSHLIHFYSDAKYIPRLSQLFPLNHQINGKKIVQADANSQIQGYKDFYYPAAKLTCTTSAPKNILLFVIDEWKTSDFNSELTPMLNHFVTHGTLFENHFSGGTNARDGLFSLIYSLPPTYLSSVLNESTEPVFITQAKELKMDLQFMSANNKSPMDTFYPVTENAHYQVMDYLTNREVNEPSAPFMVYDYFSGVALSEVDNQISAAVELLRKQHQLDRTIIVVTGTHGMNSGNSDIETKDLKTPLLVIWPGKKPSTVSKVTSHYDVLPTIMHDDWKCKNKVSDYSFGKNLYSGNEPEQLVAGDYSRLGILDSKQQTLTTIQDYSGLTFSNDNKVSISTILNALESITIFNKRR